MKIIHKLLYVWCIAWLASCSTDEYLPEAEGGKITLSISTGISVSRATTLDDTEKALSHFDVFIWKLDGTDGAPGSRAHYERIQGPLTTPDGTATLSVQKGDFTENASYRVDVIANATATEETFRGYTKFSDLSTAVQVDERIQVTGGHELGAVGTTISNVPSHFLMDGIATLVGSIDEKTAKLNDGTSTTTQLAVTLRRAAAKIEVILTHGNTIRFDKTLAAEQAMGYYLRCMPYTTSVLAENTAHEPDWRKTDLFADDTNIFFNWTEKQVKITAYVYSHSWDVNNFFERGTRMAVSLPVWYKADATETETASTENGWTEYPVNFYQVLLTKSNSFERNTRYVVEATIDMPGAIDNSEPVELTNLKYSAKDWTEVSIDLGEDSKPTYLSVNKDTLDMHNIDEDATSLSFVSSSDVSVTIKEVYFINKYGQKETVSNHGVVVTPDAGLNGNIKVNSPVPGNNTIRYIVLKVDNKDGSDSENVLVRQYPVIYITNQLGWYSYRTDFNANYENSGSRINTISVSKNGDNYVYKYENVNDSKTKGFFYSKVRSGDNSSNYYFWTSNWNRYTRGEKAYESDVNLRMYHIRLTSTSGNYVVGRPLVVDEYTDDSETNSKLVSPSFMIASHLGSIRVNNGGLEDLAPDDKKEPFKEHCKQYVEVASDGTVYDDWRLPTKAEINIILQLQGGANDNADAIDFLLNGPYYLSANGFVYNEKNNTMKNEDGTYGAWPDEPETVTNRAVRCVRDAY